LEILISMAENTTPQDGVNNLTDINTFTGPATIGGRTPLPSVALAPSIQQLPGGMNTTNKTYTIKDFTAGSTPTYSNQTNQKVAKNGIGGAARADRIQNLLNNSKDPNAYGKAYSFDNSPSGSSFKARYKGYGQETYNRLGFDPLVDNEAWYNQNTSQFDDWKRMMTHAAWPMVKLGFMSPIESYSRMLGHGDVGASQEEARDYEYFNAIGNSTKGGIGGFMTNLQNSAAYSVGIMTEGLVEGMLVGAAVGFAEGGVGAIPGAALGGITGTAKSLAKLPGALFSTAKNMGKIASSLSNLSKISNAKNFWMNAGSKLANGLNPLDNTTALIKGWEDMGDLTSLARSARTVGAFWNDVKNVNMALSEGRLEGGFTEQSTYKRLYDEYYAKHGEAPSDELQVKMMAQAKNAGFENAMKNTGLVFYSNKIAFPSITRASFLKGAPKFGKVIGTVGKEFQVIYNPGKKVAESAYTLEKIGLKNSLKALKSPKQWGSLAANYFKANLVEGLQEVGQEALAKATEDYYVNTFNNPAAKNMNYTFAALKAQMSAQGAEVFASGFLMGSLISGPTTAIQKYGTVGVNKIFKSKEAYQKSMETKEKQGTELVNALNELHKNGKNFFDPRMTNYSTQTLLANVVDNPNEHTTAQIKDLEHQAFATSVLTALQTGTFDMFLKNFADYKQTTPEELEEAWNLQPGQGEVALQNIDKAMNSAKVMAKRYEFAKNKAQRLYKNPADFKEGSIERQKTEFYNSAVSKAVNNLVFLQSSFDDTLERSQKLYGSLADLSSITGNQFADLAVLTDDSRLNNQIAMLTSQINTAEESTDPQAIEQVRKDKTTLEALNEFQKAKQTVKQFDLLKTLLSEEDLTDVQREAVDYYKESYEKLLKALAGSPEKQVQLLHDIDAKGGIDSLFSNLYDAETLKSHNSKLAQYVNLLSNPADFEEHVNRNFEWMQNLYSNRKNYYKEVVNEQMSAIEKNALLNALAEKGVYVDLEEFADWVEDHNNLPNYFIDETKGLIINQDSPLYTDYLDLFMQAADLDAIKPAGDPESEKAKMEDELNDLEERRTTDLDAAKDSYNQALKNAYGKDETGLEAENQSLIDNDNTAEQKAALENQKEEQEIYLNILNGDNIQGIIDIYPKLEELVSEEEFNNTQNKLATDKEAIQRATKRGPIFNPNAQTKEEKAEAINNAFVIEVYKNILEENIKSFEEQIKNIKSPALFDIEATKEYAVYQQEVDQINAKYDDYVQEIKDKYAEKGIDENTFEEVTTSTPYENLPEALKTEVDTEFHKYLTEVLEEDPNLQSNDPGKFESIRTNWLQSQTELFKAYGEKAKAEAVERAKQLARPPFLQFFQKQVSGQDNLNLLAQYLTNLQKIVDTGKFLNSKGKNVEATVDELAVIKADMEALKGYMESRRKVSQPQNIAQETYNNVEQNIVNRRGEVEDVFNEEGVKIGRKFVDSESEALPLRATQISDEVVTKMVGKPEFFFNKLQDGTLQELYDQYMSGTDKSIEGFMLAFERAAIGYKFTFGSNPAKIQAVRKALETLPREEFFKAVDNIAFNHRSTAGTNADALIRESLSISNSEVTFKAVPYTDSIDINGQKVKVSDIMTKEAYDALFDPNTGIIAPLLNDMFDNKLRILSNNVLVFDKNLRENGITGELDLLALTTDGELKIIDIKLSSSNTWKNYDKPDNRKQLEHRAQQSVYQTLVYNMTGITPDISILPVAFEADLNGKITSIKKASMLAEGQTVYDLEYLPEIEQAGIIRIDPAKSTTTTSVTGESTPVVKPAGTVEKTDLSKLTLQDNLGKDLVYNGKAGVLTKLDDGTFAIEHTTEDGTKQLIDLMYNGLPAKNGKLDLNKVGVSPVTEIKEVAQVSVINNVLVDAKFEDASEKTATINGVKYTVNRDKTQSIVSLSYRINDARIAAIEDRTAELTSEISKLREENKKSKDKTEKNSLLEKIAKAQQEIYSLNAERVSLVENNPERTMRGGNANDLIFALNRLPHSFTKGHTQKRSLNEKQELKDVAAVAMSSSSATEMDTILSENYPDALDKLFTQGVNSINKSELTAIKTWANETIAKLEEYGMYLLNRNDMVDEVDNQIHAINDLLNDLELINLGKNGKILKQQPEELSKKFGPDNTQEVQTGSSVPEIQKPVGEQTETVLRPATEEELKQIIESTKTKDEEIFSDWKTETPVIDFSSAKNLTELDKQVAEAINNNPELASFIADTRAERLYQIQTEISVDNLEKGEILMAKVPIFTEYADEFVYVKSIKGDKIILTDIYGEKTKTFTEAEVKEMFNKTTPEAVENMKTPAITQEDAMNSEGTHDNFENFSKDSEEINKLEREADEESDDDIFNKLKDNSKHC